MEIESNARIVVGVNKFTIKEGAAKGLLRVDPSVEINQRKKLVALKERRDNLRVQEVLATLKTAAQGTDNLVPVILEAVKCYATLGDICGVLREVFGEHQQETIF
jgi:methylmalonyl-CoA mutase N-terminal domain/subunit